MPETPRDYEAELRALMEALAESVASAPDEEIIDETRELGEDPAVSAEEVRGVLRNAVKAHEQRHLLEAQKAYERQVAAIRRRTFVLPTTPENRRKLLTFVMTRKPDLNSALLTLQHRDFKEWTDADIQKCLEQLGALGVLDEFESTPGDQQ